MPPSAAAKEVRLLFFPLLEALTDKLHQPERSLLPYIAFSGFRDNFEDPELTEGFSEIKRVNWVFEGTEEEKKHWSMWLQIDGKWFYPTMILLFTSVALSKSVVKGFQVVNLATPSQSISCLLRCEIPLRLGHHLIASLTGQHTSTNIVINDVPNKEFPYSGTPQQRGFEMDMQMSEVVVMTRTVGLPNLHRDRSLMYSHRIRKWTRKQIVVALGYARKHISEGGFLCLRKVAYGSNVSAIW